MGPDKPRNASASLKLTSAKHAVVLLQADLENAHDLELLQTRHEAAALPAELPGIMTTTRIARPHLQLVGQHSAQNDSVQSRL